MRKFIWQECKRVIIKKKILIIIMFIIVIGFGLVNTLKTKTYEEQLKQYNATLYNLKSARDTATTNENKAAFAKDIDECEKIIHDINLKLDTINNYDKSKLDEQIKKLEKENNSKNKYKINQLKYYRDNNIEKGSLRSGGIYVGFESLITFSSFFLFVLIVISSDMISGEYAPNTMKLLITKPISRKKL